MYGWGRSRRKRTGCNLKLGICTDAEIIDWISIAVNLPGAAVTVFPIGTQVQKSFVPPPFTDTGPHLVLRWGSWIRVGAVISLISRNDESFHRVSHRKGSKVLFTEIGVDLLLSGIVQQPSTCERRHFHIRRVLDLVANEVATRSYFATREV